MPPPPLLPPPPLTKHISETYLNKKAVHLNPSATSRPFVVWVQGTTAEEERKLCSGPISIRFLHIWFVEIFSTWAEGWEKKGQPAASSLSRTLHSTLWASRGAVPFPTADSFQWTRHIMREGGACNAASPAPQAYALFLCVCSRLPQRDLMVFTGSARSKQDSTPEVDAWQNVAKCETSSVIWVHCSVCVEKNEHNYFDFLRWGRLTEEAEVDDRETLLLSASVSGSGCRYCLHFVFKDCCKGNMMQGFWFLKNGYNILDQHILYETIKWLFSNGND